MKEDSNSEKTSEEAKTSPPAPNIGAEIDLFINQIDALAETLPLAAKAINDVVVRSRQQLAEFFSGECKTVTPAHGKAHYRLDGNQYLKYARLQRRTKKASLAQTLVPRGVFVALVSQFDAYVGALVRNFFRLRPEIVDASGKSLTFSELVKFDSLDAARDFMVEKEIDALLRESHSDQFDWLEKKFNIALRKGLPAWPVFIELTERRNLFVHTNGIVSRQYLDVCGKHSCQLHEGIRIGESLPLAREYLSAAYQCLFELGVKLGQVLWRKLAPDQIAEADANLATITYALVSDGRYQLARQLLDFATDLPRYSAEDLRLRFAVNRAQTYKWMGDEEKCKKVVGAEDWTAMNLKFQLAHAVLTDNFAGAISIVKRIGTDESELDKHSYREWPLFKEFRKHPDFIKLFEGIFGEPLNNVVVQGPHADGTSSDLVN